MQLELLAPELTLAGTAIAVILVDLFVARKWLLEGVSIAGLLIAADFTIAMWGGSYAPLFNNMLAVDSFALGFKLLFLGIAILVILASIDYAARFSPFRGEYYALVLLSTMGMMLLAGTAELVSIYIALEMTSLSMCALVCFLKDARSGEAALKYVLLSAIASAVLLFGMALVFGFTGETRLGGIALVIQSMSTQTLLASPALTLGMALLIAGFGFKIAAVPFHMWTPDVYEGAPTPVTAFLSVGSKAAGFAIILRVFHSAFGLPNWLSLEWGLVFAVLAAIGMTLGNVAAIPQANIKRMLGYSSIAQAGYLMVGLATTGLSPASDVLGRSGLIFFLASYALTNLGAFTAVIAISNRIDSDLIDDYSGMGKRAPLLSLGLTLCLVSLIGIPPAAGFMAKFYIFSGAVQNGLLWLVVIAVINSVISAYYYLRVVKMMWLGKPAVAEAKAGKPASEARVTTPATLRVALAVSCAGVLVLGIAPGYVLRLAEMAASMFIF
ncbi:MAG: NADH-quinone oxidoreductase subunit N [Chloroflexi bacterium]|nr:NADH-quinone oxidoreductase subunit N [Chloroflexota bacterium]